MLLCAFLRECWRVVTHNGIAIRMRVADIRTMGRNTKGVRVINLKHGDAIADVTRLVLDEDVADAPDETPGEDGAVVETETSTEAPPASTVHS